MKAQIIFLATCIAAFTLTSCEKEVLPEIKPVEKNPANPVKAEPIFPDAADTRDIINLGKPVPVDLKNHERRGSVVKADALEIIDFTDRMDTTIRNSSAGVELQQHERTGVLSVKKSIKYTGYPTCVRPIKPAKPSGRDGLEKIERLELD